MSSLCRLDCRERERDEDEGTADPTTSTLSTAIKTCTRCDNRIQCF